MLSQNMFRFFPSVHRYLHRNITYLPSNSNVLYLKDRGLIQQVFPAEKPQDLTNALIGSPQTIYCGFDPTADSLHIGNLLSLLTLMHCYRGGHQVIGVIGTATALIGDPSGRHTEREPIGKEEVLKNAQAIKENITRVFDNCREYYGENKRKAVDPIVLFNGEWYEGVNAVDFMHNVGRYFRMGSMLSRQSVQTRLKSPEGMSLTEFMYQVFQACDWLHLYKQYNCRIQLGGSDQMGNIMSGVHDPWVDKDKTSKTWQGDLCPPALHLDRYDLIRHVTGKSSVFGITTPLVTNTAGNKLGKSAGNAVWLDSKKTPAFDLYQYFIRLPDDDVEKYLRLFTFLSDDSLREVMLKQRSNPEQRPAQTLLAREVCRLVHGDAGLQSAIRCTNALYGETVEQLAQLSSKELKIIFSNADTVELFLDPGTTVLDAVVKAKCFHNVGDAERVIKAGGVYVNHRRVNQPDAVLLPREHILPNNITVVRVGKKNYYIIKWLGGL